MLKENRGASLVDLESRYEFIEKIGTGSFATVYRARDNELGREVAIKQIHEQYLNEPEHLNRYWQEAQLLASLHHPNIVTIFDIYRERGWLIMELMQANLAERMEGRQMDLRALRATLAHALRALKYLHARGIIHGDVKTSNLMIDSRKRVKLGDFGLARRASDDEGSLLKGTTKYMAPEVVDERFGDVGPASDLYSLGFAAYELMCGPNFEDLFPGLSAFGRNKQVAWMMWHAAPDRRLPEINRVLQGVPDDLVKVIQKLCEKDQNKRYKSADEALADLELGEKGSGSGTGPVADVGVEEGEETKPDRKRTWILAGAVGFSLLLSILMLWPGGGNNSGNPEEIQNVGFVRSIEPGANLLVWEDPEKGIPRDLKIAGEPEIFFRNDKKYIQLREINPGDRIEWEVEGSGSSAKFKIFVTRPILNRGIISDFDPQKNTVTVTIEDGDVREDLTLRVPQRARVQVNGQDVRLGDLRQGDRVEIKHLNEVGGKDGRVIEYIEAKRTEEKVGYLTEFDRVKNSLRIRLGDGFNSEFVTLPLAEDCEVTLKVSKSGAGLPLEIGDLKESDRIRYHYDTAIHQIEITRGEKKLIGAAIQEIRMGEMEILVTTRRGEMQTFRIGRNCDVTVTQASAELNDLRKHDTVTILYDEELSPGQPVNAISVDAFRPVKSDRTAILIGVQAFQHDGLSPLPYARYNTSELRRTLIERYSFAPNRIVMILDEPASTIQSRVQKELREVRSEIQLVVYVCTQAYETSQGEIRLAGTDYNPDQPETGVSLGWLISELESCSSKDKLLLFDCSHAGKGQDLERQPSAAVMLETVQSQMKTLSAIASCDKGQHGHNLEEEKLSLFAFALSRGFAGNADPDYNLHITPQELWRYLSVEMSTRPLQDGTTQRPVLMSP